MKKYQKSLSLLLTLMFTFLTLMANTPVKAASKSDPKDAFLKGLSVKYGVITTGFDKEVEAYNVYTDAAVKNVLIKATLSNSKAKLMVNGVTVKNGAATSVELSSELTNAVIAVTSQDGTITKNYTLCIQKASENDSNLIDIKLNPVVEGFVFNKEVTENTIEVNNEVQSIKLTPYAADSRSVITVIVNGATGKRIKSGSSTEVKLTTGENVVTINVKNATSKVEGIPAGDKTYTLKINRGLNTNSNLKSIVVSPGTMDKRFEKSITNYTVTLRDSDKKVSIVPVAETKTSKVSVLVNDVAVTANGTKYEVLTPNPGSYNVTVTVEAEDTALKTTYNFNLIKPDAADNTLSDIKLSEGTLNPDFSKDIDSYKIQLENSVQKLKIEPVGSNPSAKIKTYLNGKQIGTTKVNAALLEGENLIEIKVYSNDESKKEKIYKIVIDRIPQPTVKVTGVVYNTDKVLSKSKLSAKENTYQVNLSDLKDSDVINSITINVPENSYAEKLVFNSNKEISLVKGDNIINDLSLFGIADAGQEISIAYLKKLADKKGYVTLPGKLYGTYKENEITKDVVLQFKLNTKAVLPGKLDSIINRMYFNMSDMSSLEAKIEDNKIEFEYEDIDESLRIVTTTIEVSKDCTMFLNNKTIELKQGANILTLGDFGIPDSGNDGVYISTIKKFGKLSMKGNISDGTINYPLEIKIEFE